MQRINISLTHRKFMSIQEPENLLPRKYQIQFDTVIAVRVQEKIKSKEKVERRNLEAKDFTSCQLSF